MVIGTLSDGESVVVDITENISKGAHTFTTLTAGGSIVDRKYDGNNEARAHVKKITINGVDNTIDKFLAEGESNVSPIDRADTLQGENSVTVTLEGDSETQQVDRLDVRGRYEGRTVLANATVNGSTRDPTDLALASGETHSINITDDVGYGDNDFRVDLAENSTQNEYDLNISWFLENRTYFANVSVNGDQHGSPTFLGFSEVLSFNVTDSLVSGSNTHGFRMQSPKTTTDTLDFVEKMNFSKNVSVTIEEAHATYDKTSDEEFDHKVSSGAFFNFSLPDRVMRLDRTEVTFNGTTSATNSTTLSGDTETVEVQEAIPSGTNVSVRVELLTYDVVNATDDLRDESHLADPYLVDVGISSVSGDVGYETIEPSPTDPEYEVILTNGSGIDREAVNATFDGNVTVSSDHFSTYDGMVVRRPTYSTDTFTGTTNVIYPDPVVEPSGDVTHDEPLSPNPTRRTSVLGTTPSRDWTRQCRSCGRPSGRTT